MWTYLYQIGVHTYYSTTLFFSYNKKNVLKDNFFKVI